MSFSDALTFNLELFKNLEAVSLTTANASGKISSKILLIILLASTSLLSICSYKSSFSLISIVLLTRLFK